MLCTFEFGDQINNLRLSLSHSQVSRKKRHGRVLSDGTWGGEGRVGLYASVCGNCWFVYCLLLYVSWSPRRSVWGRGGQDLKQEGIAAVLQADFLNYSRCGVSPCNSHRGL